MPKIFYTERDIDDMKARGVTSLDITDNVVITDLALERAMRYEMKINRADVAPAPKASFSGSVNLVAAYQREMPAAAPVAFHQPPVDVDLKAKIKSLVLAKLNGQVDAALLDAVITKVLAGMR